MARRFHAPVRAWLVSHNGKQRRPGGWSIAAEFTFYLCLPFLFRRVKSLSAALWLTLGSIMVASIILTAVRPILLRAFPAEWASLIDQFLYFSFPSQLPVFCLGIVLYYLLLGRIAPETAAVNNAVLDAPNSVRSLPLFLSITAFLVVFGLIPRHVICAIAFVALSYGLSLQPLRLVVNRVTVFIGKVSFSAYIWHFWVIDHIPASLVARLNFHRVPAQLSATVQFAALYVAALLLTLPLASASYLLIELPGQHAGRMLIRRLAWGRRTDVPSAAKSAVTV